jgi:hypothetical protein
MTTAIWGNRWTLLDNDKDFQTHWKNPLEKDWKEITVYSHNNFVLGLFVATFYSSETWPRCRPNTIFVFVRPALLGWGLFSHNAFLVYWTLCHVLRRVSQEPNLMGKMANPRKKKVHLAKNKRTDQAISVRPTPNSFISSNPLQSGHNNSPIPSLSSQAKICSFQTSHSRLANKSSLLFLPGHQTILLLL